MYTLHMAACSVRVSPIVSTGKAPMHILLGRPPNYPTELENTIKESSIIFYTCAVFNCIQCFDYVTMNRIYDN